MRQLRASFDEEVLPILADLIEPPDLGQAEESLVTLWSYGMIEQPVDSPLTQSGALAAALPIDYRLSRMLALSVQLDCCREAIIIASALTLARPVYRIASSLIHDDPALLNEIVRTTFFSRHEFEQGMGSEAFAAVALYARLLPLMKSDGGGNGQENVSSQRHHVLRFGRKAELFCTSHMLAKKEVEAM